MAARCCGTATTLFSEGFEAGTAGWTGTAGMTLQNTNVHSGAWAAQARATGGAGAYALKLLSAPQTGIYARAWVNVASQSTVMNLIRLQSSVGANILTVFVSLRGT